MSDGTIIPIRRLRVVGGQRGAPKARATARPAAVVPSHTAPFAALPLDARELLISRCKRKRLSKGEPIFIQGERHVANYIVESGLARTYYTSSTGKEVTMAYWSAGDLLGGPNFLTTDTNHVWSAQAAEEATVWTLSAEELEKLVHNSPPIARFLIDSMTVKLFWSSSLLQAFGTQSVFLRLAHLMLKLADMYGVPTRTGIAIRHHFTQADLANMVGATRQWVSTTLSHFQRDNIVICRKCYLEIQNIDLLRRLVGEGKGPGHSGK
jgi:CRP/FNR family cyclic AMP-dependent transcriptional regulator